MLKTEGQNWIYNLRIKWITLYLIRILAITLAIALVLTALFVYGFHLQLWVFAIVFPLLFAIALFIKPIWKSTDKDFSRYVNNKYPELEESADLLLQDPAELSIMQRLQQHRIETIISTLPQPKEPVKRLYIGLAILLAALLMSFGITKIPQIQKTVQSAQTNQADAPAIKENIPAEIADFSATIIPPAYTGKAERKQKQFTIKAETGANVNWKIETNIGIKQLKIIFNDKETVLLKPINATNWVYSKVIEKSGFYQIVLDGKKSDLYQMEVIPDLPVTIKISQPKQHTTIDVGRPQKFNLNVSLNDDYGINDAFISATMASGKGEGVSFTEKKLSFNSSFNNQKSLNLSKQIDLKSLGMKPGDELYFFIKAMDNHGQSSRSDVYFVSIVDTTELMSMAGMTNGVNLVPEYFRSQRQIIIDTEKLLKEQPTLSAEAFKTRSNELGIDQKLLRLRYGQFLGEESETEIGGDHDDHTEHKGEEEKFGDVSAIMDKYAHKHDIAEDATFFEPEMKAQLKAVLTEMWTSELRLRTYKPQEALPFEYKALRLLKDLQQKSRAYVAKTTIKTASLKPEKRLSGELDKITQPVQKMTFEQKEQRIAHLKTSLALLESRKTGKKFNDVDRFLLSNTEKYIIGAAADNPATYLNALTSLRRLVAGNKLMNKDIDLVQQAIQKMIKGESSTPQLQNTQPASALYQNYFNNLNKAGR
ncbi:phage holin family protein [Pedobacter mucosus]|uniref:phage holin family protein n=1 Tax=Pedobacter mucosus TaxID=2895286 RepID=UPI001EE3C6E3|nr:phage holin family protein [Pedobacter mucosus]UKT66051.1 phage holin family protein [Pedobacter mucosus]